MSDKKEVISHEDHYLKFEEIKEQVHTLEKISTEMKDSFTKIEAELNNLNTSWNGDAYEEYYNLVKGVTKYYTPAYEELVKSIVFLCSVCEGYEALTSDSARALIETLGYGSIGGGK